MPRQSRRKGYGRKRISKHVGGGYFDDLSQQASQLSDVAVQKAKDMGLKDQLANAHQAAIGHATKAQQMVSDASSQAMATGVEAHKKMQGHLDLAASHANDALKHAQNQSKEGFDKSMDDFAESMGNAGTAGADHIRNNTKIGEATLAQQANALGSKASKFLGLGASNPAATPAPAAQTFGGRRRKSRKHPKKGQKSRTKKGRRRQSKSAKRRSYRSRKGGNQRRMWRPPSTSR